MPEAIAPTRPTPVSARPPDHLGGATLPVGPNPGDLQAAINASVQGDTLVVPAGPTYHPIILPPRSGGGWTRIRTAGRLPASGTRIAPAHAAALFTVRSPTSGVAPVTNNFAAGTQGWHLVGMDASWGLTSAQFSVIDLREADRIILDRCYVHGNGTQNVRRAMFAAFLDDFQVWDSWFEAQSSLTTEGQGLFARGGTRQRYDNSEFRGSGQCLFFGDEDSSAPCVDITVTRNHFFSPLTWKRNLGHKDTGPINPVWDGGDPTNAHKPWSVKVGFEIKWMVRGLIEGNHVENMWWWGQSGNGVLFNLGGRFGPAGLPDDHPSSDILFQYNTISNAWHGIVVNFAQALNNTPQHRIAVIHNLFERIPGLAFYLSPRIHDLRFDHNTVVPMDDQLDGLGPVPVGNAYRWAIFANYLKQADSWRNLTITNNAIGPYRPSAMNAGAWTTDAWNTAAPTRVFGGNHQFGKTGASPVAGFTHQASAAAAGIDPVTGQLLAGSPLVGAATDGADVGVNHAALAAAMGGPPAPPTFTLSTPTALALQGDV